MSIKSCISIFFASPIGTKIPYYFNPTYQRHVIDTTDHIIPFFCCEFFLNPVISNNKQFSNILFWRSKLNLVIFRFEPDCFLLVISFFVDDFFFSYISVGFCFG